jgi:hypothetical protein
MGLEGAQVLHALAGANDKEFKRILSLWDQGGAKASGLAKQVAGPLAGAVDKLTGVLIQLAKHLGFDITIDDHDIDNARTKLSSFIAEFNNKQVTIYVKHREERHSGGPILHGGGPARGRMEPGLASDERVAVVQTDEHMWSRDEVRGAGGHGRVAALRRAALQGLLRFHEGGPVGHGHGGGGGDPLDGLLLDFERLSRQINRLAKDSEKRGQLEGQLDKIRSRISAEEQRRVDAQTRDFERLQERIDELVSTIDSFQASVRDAILGFADVTRQEYEAFTEAQATAIKDLMQKGMSQDAAMAQLGITPADAGQQLLDNLATQLEQAEHFSNLLQTLTQKGLDPALVQQLAAAGPEALDILRAIEMAGVENVNALQAQIDAVADSLASTLTEPLFGKQAEELDRAANLFSKSLDKFREEFKALPKDVQKEFRQSVGELVGGIAAVTKALGKLIPGSPVHAASGYSGWVTSPTLFLAGEAGAERVEIVPAARMAGLASGGNSGESGGNSSHTIIRERIIERGTTVGPITINAPGLRDREGFRREVLSAVKNAVADRSLR